jgi:hypothetical protein
MYGVCKKQHNLKGHGNETLFSFFLMNCLQNNPSNNNAFRKNISNSHGCHPELENAQYRLLRIISSYSKQRGVNKH